MAYDVQALNVREWIAVAKLMSDAVGNNVVGGGHQGKQLNPI